ncbi:AAA family ATPase [Paenibacillus agaridevorans]|uniref:AAA family ATPase n=1 Tax=Paenibacillus agaridevorans TaxID=171404 RepID=UPI001BE468E2|nr:SMC family ATPase [Paenibacillus agaridevorans]
MRPLKLTMTAFGPYRDAETVDFAELGERRLFVISGNTGAGKTTIFDAITFAIYGTASGEDRADPRMLRSHFADDETHTSVELDFQSGGRCYRVFRQMKHRKGGNRSETGEKTELYVVEGETAVPAVDRFITTEVNARLLAVIGLTKEQFSQIVMLPQGEFRKLLTSDTDNKEDILRRIFRTELFERLEGRFQARYRELSDGLKDARATTAAVMRQAEEALPQREDSPLAATFRQENYNAVQVREALQGEAAHYEDTAAAAGRRKLETASALDALQDSLRARLSLNAKHEELAAKRTQRQTLAARQGEIEGLERELALAAKADGLTPYAEQAANATKLLKLRYEGLRLRSEQLAAAESEQLLAAASHDAEANKEPQRREVELELHRLSELTSVVESLAAQREALAELKRREMDSQSKLAAAAQSIAASKQSRQRTALEQQECEAAAAALPEKAEALAGLERQGKGVKRLLELSAEIGRWMELEREGERALSAAKSGVSELERRWIEGQAGLLAKHLHDGDACPVCGSVTHPQKAGMHEEMPSKEELEGAKETLAAVQRELMTSKAQAAAATGNWQAELDELAELLPPLPPEEQNGQRIEKLRLVQGELRQAWKSCKEELDALKEKSGRLESLRSAISKSDKELETLERELDRLRAETQSLALENAGKETAYAKELERVPEQWREKNALRTRQAERQSLLAELNRSWQVAQQRLQAAAANLAAAKAHAEQATEQAAEAELSEKESRQRLYSELAKAGFLSAEDYAGAVRTQAEQERLKQETERYRTAVLAAAEAVAALESELSGTEWQSPEDLQGAILTTRGKHEELLGEEQSSLRFAAEAARLAASVDRAARQAGEMEEKLERVLDIYGMMKGDNSLKMSFERYILIEYLEQIVAMANVRLHELSGGQFQLQRSDRLETRGKQSGLGLDVYDAYTGQNRDVKSLSGGEKFNASLCLALGMTDVIQSHQGGVSIDMMLIDEGFGSLDEESLHKAIAALVDLQKAGRMIGVISHVQELKEAFPACLEVNKTKEGYSTTSFLLK